MDRDELLIERLISGELTEAERAVLERRAAQDPALGARIVAEQALTEDLAVLATLRAPGALHDAVMARLAQREARGWRRVARWFGRRLELPAPTWALAAGLLLALGYALGRGAAAPPQDAPTAGGESGAVAAGPTATEPAAHPACDDAVLVRFVYAAPDASTVAVAGDFNGWEPAPMSRAESAAAFTATLRIPSGTHEYVFVVDGQRFVPDPLAGRYRDDGFGNRNALIELAQLTDL
ncbi:MAG: hypothetical protein AMXMBFR64_42290 [Myxococcales bacterium]